MDYIEFHRLVMEKDRSLSRNTDKQTGRQMSRDVERVSEAAGLRVLGAQFDSLSGQAYWYLVFKVGEHSR